METVFPVTHGLDLQACTVIRTWCSDCACL